jgi:hypothetical protein
VLTAPADYVFERQTTWARRRGLRLGGSAGIRGRQAYTQTLEDNLFEPLSAEARTEFAAGDGSELGKGGEKPGKMQAVHSSSALSCNLFHYWRRVKRLDIIAKACGLPAPHFDTLAFERHFPIDPRFRYAPNLDAVFSRSSGPVNLAAIECKFCEAFSTRPHAGMKEKYLDGGVDDLLKSMPRVWKLAKELSPDNSRYQHLDAAQLVKHLLGLKRYSQTAWVLLYLYYDVPGPAGSKHAEEVRDFVELARQDGVLVCSATYQDVLLKLAREHRAEHGNYIDYMVERYL